MEYHASQCNFAERKIEKMSRYNYIDEELTVKGPVDVSQLPALGVTESTLVWKEGMKDWVPARTIPEIVDAIAGYAAHQASTLEPAQEPPLPHREPLQLRLTRLRKCCKAISHYISKDRQQCDMYPQYWTKKPVLGV